MKAAIRFILTTIGLLLIGAFIAAVLLLTQFEGTLRDLVTSRASRILGADVHLEGVRLDWARQGMVLKGVSVMNPEGFTDRTALRIESVSLEPDPLTLFSKTPRVKRVHAEGGVVHLQYKAGSGTNVGALMNQARAWAESQDADEKAVWGRRVKVHSIVSSNVDTRVESISPPTPAIPLAIEAFTLEDPGQGNPVSGARMVYLGLRGFLRQLSSLEGISATLRQALPGDSNGD